MAQGRHGTLLASVRLPRRAPRPACRGVGWGAPRVCERQAASRARHHHALGRTKVARGLCRARPEPLPLAAARRAHQPPRPRDGRLPGDGAALLPRRRHGDHAQRLAHQCRVQPDLDHRERGGQRLSGRVHGVPRHGASRAPPTLLPRQPLLPARSTLPALPSPPSCPAPAAAGTDAARLAVRRGSLPRR